jgi:hypothetical protein
VSEGAQSNKATAPRVAGRPFPKGQSGNPALGPEAIREALAHRLAARALAPAGEAARELDAPGGPESPGGNGTGGA